MEELKKFESVCIFKEKTEIEAYEKFSSRIHEILETITKLDYIGIKNLAYEIKGNKKGYYVLLQFTATEKQVTELEKYYRLNDDIIKFITIRLQLLILTSKKNILKKGRNTNENNNKNKKTYF